MLNSDGVLWRRIRGKIFIKTPKLDQNSVANTFQAAEEDAEAEREEEE